MNTVDPDKRRFSRHAMQHPAKLTMGGELTLGCEILDFCEQGMALRQRLVRRTARSVLNALRPGSTVTVTFELPGLARALRARSMLRWRTLQGADAVSGVYFRRTNPLILRSMLEVARDHAARVAAANQIANGLDTVEDIDSGETVDLQFLTRVYESLVAQSQRPDVEKSQYFNALMAIKSDEERINARLTDALAADNMRAVDVERVVRPFQEVLETVDRSGEMLNVVDGVANRLYGRPRATAKARS